MEHDDRYVGHMRRPTVFNYQYICNINFILFNVEHTHTHTQKRQMNKNWIDNSFAHAYNHQLV